MAFLEDELHVQARWELVEMAGLPLLQLVRDPHLVVAAREDCAGHYGHSRVRIACQDYGAQCRHCWYRRSRG